MRRILPLLRASFLPLLAVSGVALLVFGIADWRRFYRDLYVEEQAALVALHAATGDVHYRRTGDVEDRWTVPDANEPVPTGAPFAGRVEAIWVNRPTFHGQTFPPGYLSVPQAVRDRALRLPGLASYREDTGSFVWATKRPLDPERILKRELPAFEPPLDKAELDAVFPRGESIEESEREGLLETIEAAWRAADPGDEAKLVVSDGYAFVAALNDGGRSWRYERSPSDLRRAMPAGGVHETVEFSDGTTFRTIDAFHDERFVLEQRPANSPFLPPLETRLHDSPFYPAMIPVSYHDVGDGILDLTGKPVQAVERIDDSRVRIAFEPFEVSDSSWTFRLVDAEIVLRSDMDWALERAAAHVDTYSIDWRKAYPDAPPQYVETYQEVRRLARAGDRVYSAERLRRNLRLNKGEQVPLSESSERFAVEFAPAYSDAIFDVRAYPETTPLPEPTGLPLIRRYRVLFAGGLLVIGVASVGIATGIGRRRRPGGVAERAMQDSRPKERRRSRLPSLRFGFATLGAAALLTISAAGWFRSKLDAVEEEFAALGALSRAGAEFEIERREPSLLWTWLASETWPIDSPVVAIRIVGDVPEEACAPVLRLPDVQEFRWSEYEPGFLDSPIETPEFADFAVASGQESPVEEAFQEPLPRGESATPEESRRVVTETFAAWAAARRDFPKRYVARLHEGDLGPSQHPAAPIYPVVARDGDRASQVWATGFDGMPQALCDDGRFLYWFASHSSKAPFPWRLRERHGRESAGRSRIERWMRSANERSPLSDFTFYEESALSRFVKNALSQEPPGLNAASVERLPGTRWRIEFEPPRIAPFGGYDLTYIRTWFVVVDEALDWSIVERYLETYDLDDPAEDLSGQYVPPMDQSRSSLFVPPADPFGDPPVRRSAPSIPPPAPFGQGAVRRDYRTIDRVEMHEGIPIVIQSRTCRKDGVWGEGYKYPTTLVWSYDFEPQFAEGTFRSPDLGASPTPEPRIPPIFAWYQATALLACGIFGYGLVRRFVGKRRQGETRA